MNDSEREENLKAKIEELKNIQLKKAEILATLNIRRSDVI